MKMVVLCVATLWVTTKNAPFSDRNKSFQTFLKTFEIASKNKIRPIGQMADGAERSFVRRYTEDNGE